MKQLDTLRIFDGKSLAILAFSVVIALLSVVSYLVASDFPRGARLFPQVVSVIVVVLAGLLIVATIVRARKGLPSSPEGPETSDLTSDTTFAEVWPYLVWVVGAYTGMYLIGFAPAAALFCLLFLWRVARMKWWGNIAMTAFCLATVLALGVGLNISWPRGILPALFL